MAIPKDHISLLIADGHRARQWQLGLSKQGLNARAIETSGSCAAKGDYWLVVPSEERFAGQRFVSDVLAGRADLPQVARIRGPLLWGASIIVIAVLGLVVAAILT